MTNHSDTARAETTTNAVSKAVRAFRESDDGYRWEDVPVKEYKNEGSHFRDITRQVLFTEGDGPSAELRYFEIQAGGHSTFERHDHTHAVLILRGRGRTVVDRRVTAVSPFDLVEVPPQTWHQFIADDKEPLGFLCLVACERDRPTRPDPDDRSELLADPHLGDVIRL